MYLRLLNIIIAGFIFICLACNPVPGKNTIDLSGEWAFQIDSHGHGSE